ncbi:MAG: glycoside hydrolase family 88 protein [Lachnospiraceae bacterium]|nr:glycoside hydrolase family 88 protein [Lachnospiraceae bacterium]
MFNAAEVSEKIKFKMRAVAARNTANIPYTAVDGRFDDRGANDICWWTNGFWGGMMWQLYHATKEPLYLEIAERTEVKLDAALNSAQGMDHDSGFRWMPTAVANYRLNANLHAKNRALLAATNLAGRFNSAGRFIRAWNDGGDGNNAGWAIIDCMMNLPLLYWAWGETKDPRFYHIATMHADTARKYFIRADGSAKHIVTFDPKTGDYQKSLGGQGYRHGSSWTRGQAWAIYGFTLSYLYTGEVEYLKTAIAVADYFVSKIPVNGYIPVDFRQPKEYTWEDDSAAAIAACGLLELAEAAEDDHYKAAAIRMLDALCEDGANLDEDTDQILERCSAAFHEESHEYPIIYGDYFFIEAIFKLTGEEFPIWYVEE